MNDMRPDATAPANDVTLRFGPGIPPGVADRWRNTGKPRNALPRRIGGVAVTLAIAVLSGTAVWWLLRGGGPAVRVTGATVTAPTKVQGCDATVKIVGVIRTNGGAGSVAYRWRRSDGQLSEVFTDRTRKGQRSLRVPLRWTVKGPGTLRATATLEIVRPAGPVTSAFGSFTYTCR